MSQKQVDLARLQKAVRADGVVIAWDLREKRWRKLQPVDAREQLAMGSITLDPPKNAPAVPAEFDLSPVWTSR